MPNKRINGKAYAARARVLAEARRKGKITNERAKEIGGWQHAYYHLQILCRQKLLKHTDFGVWEPTKSRALL